MSELFKQVFQVADPTTGEVKSFDTKAEALDFLRKPKILQALNTVTNNNAELNEWIYKNQDLLEDIFSTGTIARVTKAEKKKIEKAFEALAVCDLPKDCAFITENAQAFMDSFRWPTVKRMDDDEKAKEISTQLLAATEGNQDLVDWVVANKLAVFEAFEAGKIKREVASSATEALAEYRAKMAQLKVLKDALASATKDGGDVAKAESELKAYQDEMAAEKAIKEAAKAKK